MSENDKSLPPSNSLTSDVAQIVRGMCIGAADVVPGISGGTVALVLRIYGRLVTAISHFDTQLLRLIRQGEWRGAAAHIDFRFLAALGVGIALGFALSVNLIHRLLEDPDTRPFVQATFFGLVLASSWIVGKMVRANIERWTWNIWFAMAVGVVIACTIALMNPATAAPEPPLWYIFVCGCFAICAMILPGISGALILLLLGVYPYLISVIKQVLHREELAANLPVVAVFGMGCIVGLLTFSRILRELLGRKPGLTLAMLCGLMIGSLPVLWPFQRDTTPEVESLKEKVFRPDLPPSLDGRVMMILGTILLAVIVTLVADAIANRLGRSAAKII